MEVTTIDITHNFETATGDGEATYDPLRATRPKKRFSFGRKSAAFEKSSADEICVGPTMPG